MKYDIMALWGIIKSLYDQWSIQTTTGRTSYWCQFTHHQALHAVEKIGVLGWHWATNMMVEEIEEVSRHQEHGDEPEARLGLNSCELRDVPTDPDGVETGRGRRSVMVGASGGSVNLRRCQACTRSNESAPSRYTTCCIYRPLVVCVQPRGPLYYIPHTRTVTTGTSRCTLFWTLYSTIVRT